MQEDINSLHENHTYKLVELPNDKKVLKNKWFSRLEIEANNSTKIQGMYGCKGILPNEKR